MHSFWIFECIMWNNNAVSKCLASITFRIVLTFAFIWRCFYQYWMYSGETVALFVLQHCKAIRKDMNKASDLCFLNSNVLKYRLNTIENVSPCKQLQLHWLLYGVCSTSLCFVIFIIDTLHGNVTGENMLEKIIFGYVHWQQRASDSSQVIQFVTCLGLHILVERWKPYNVWS